MGPTSQTDTGRGRMRFQEILEACWQGYRQAGMKKKGNRQVPNCVPVAEVTSGPEITGKDLLFKAAAMAMRDASHEGISLDYEQAIRQASKLYGIPYTPSELPKLIAQRAEIDRQLALLKQGKQVAKARRKEKLAPTPAGAEEYWKSHALPIDRIKPPAKSLEEQLEEDLKKWFKEKWVRFGPDGKIRGDCARGSSKEGKPKCLPQSKAQALGKKGRAASAAKKRREDPNPERRGPAKNVATKVREEQDKTGGSMYQHREVYMVVHNGKEVAFYKPANMKQAYHDAEELVNRFGGEAHVKKVMREGIQKDLRTELADKYRELAPKIERHRDSYLAGELYDALEEIAAQHGAMAEFRRMMNGARNRAHMDYDTNPGGFQNWFWYLPFADNEQGLAEGTDELKKKMSKLEALALAANRAGDDAKCKMYQQKIQSLKQKLSQNIAEESQDDRNARIIAGEIEDAMSQGNESLAQQKMQKLKQLGYYFDKQGRLQRMGMYEADTMSASGRARQQASRYNVDSETYRAQPMPSVGPKDITQKFQQVPRASHQDLVTRQNDLDDPIEKTELKIDRQRLQQLIKSQIKTLKPIEQEILIDRYWHDLSYAQIGKRLNLSVERIRQIEAKTLRKLRHPSRSADTKPFLDPDYVKPKPPTPLKSIVDPALAYKTGYNDAMSGQQHRFKTAYMSSNEPYDAGYEAGKRKKQTFNLDRVSDMAEEQLDEKQDACYHKVKSRYKVWPSAYASGALVQCRKKGAANWGNKGKK
jgi:RNA polymerase sigma factor (sigma-70 family)